MQGKDPEEVKTYLKTMKKLQDKLEEKSHLMEAEGEKLKLQYEREIETLGQDLSQSNRELQQKSETIKIISKQVKQLEEDLAHYRKESVTVKDDNKKYRADNKIIMRQIDRLTQNHSSPEEKQKVSD